MSLFYNSRGDIIAIYRRISMQFQAADTPVASGIFSKIVKVAHDIDFKLIYKDNKISINGCNALIPIQKAY